MTDYRLTKKLTLSFLRAETKRRPAVEQQGGGCVKNLVDNDCVTKAQNPRILALGGKRNHLASDSHGLTGRLRGHPICWQQSQEGCSHEKPSVEIVN